MLLVLTVLATLFINGLLSQNSDPVFEVKYEWSYLNYTWNSEREYNRALSSKRYIPENNIIGGIKLYKNKLYISVTRLKPGTPVTLAYIRTDTNQTRNQLLTPFPSWQKNVQKDCWSLQNVQSMEIDTKGIMWVLDGTRLNNLTSCAAKLVLLDLNNNGTVIHRYIFKDEIASRKGAFLNDIVIEEAFGGYAYIPDTSEIDPGLVVYSRQQNKAWKLRDTTMFTELNAPPIIINGTDVVGLQGIDGIAMSPLPKDAEEDRIVFYSTLMGLNMYSLNTSLLRNEDNFKTSDWRRKVKFVGKRISQSDGMIIDNQGFMYLGMLNRSSILRWNINTPFADGKEIFVDTQKLLWPDSFGMDDRGNLYNLAESVYRYLNPSTVIQFNNEIKIRIFQAHTGNKNYMYSAN